jgi:hypothetical protein
MSPSSIFSVPPRSLIIVGDRGRQIPNGDTVGPFKEDDPFTVLCVATGGEVKKERE